MKTQSQNTIWGVGSILALLLVLAPLSVTLAHNEAEAQTTRPAAKKIETDRLEEKREAIKEKVEERKQELSERLSTRRQTLAARLKSNMGQRNIRLSTLYTKHLERLTRIVDKIESRRAVVARTGVDTSEVEEAIATAREVITKAQEAVAAQQKKTYDLDLTNTEEFGQAVKEGVSTVRSDHEALREVLQAARDAVKDALDALKDILPTLSPSLVPSSSPTISPAE